MPSVIFQSWLPLRCKTARPRSNSAPSLRDLASLGLGWQITTSTGRFTSDDASCNIPQTGIGMYVHVYVLLWVCISATKICLKLKIIDHPIFCSGSSSTPRHSFGRLHANGTKTDSWNKPRRRALFKASLTHALECVPSDTFPHPILTQRAVRDGMEEIMSRYNISQHRYQKNRPPGHYALLRKKGDTMHHLKAVLKTFSSPQLNCKKLLGSSWFLGPFNLLPLK